MTSKKAFTKKQAIPRYVFAFVLIIAGIVTNYLEISKEFLGFQSIGTWMIFVGFIMLAIITISLMTHRKRIVDERMEKLAYQASRVTFLFIIFGAFIVMIWDGISPINIPYSLFMSHMIAWIMVVYFISYKVIEKVS